MLTSNPQLEGQIRTLVMFFGGLAVGYGWIKESQLTQLMAVAVAAVPIFGMVWSWWVNRPAALVQAAASTDIVEKIKLDPRMDSASAIDKSSGPKVTMSETPTPGSRKQPKD